MMFCSKCGTQLPDNAAFCAKCGAPCAPGAQPNPNAWQADSQQAWNQPAGQQPAAAPAKPVLTPEQKKERLFRILSYIPILFWIPMALNPADETGRKTGNQGLWLLIVDAAAWVINLIFSLVFSLILRVASYSYAAFTAVGVLSVIVSVIVWALVILTVVLAVIGIIFLLQGRVFELPLVGKIRIIRPLPEKDAE